MPSSITSPAASRKRASTALRGAGAALAIVAPTTAARDPEMRTMPMPPRPGGVAIAAMVSRATGTESLPGRSSLAMRRLVPVEHALDVPLLGDREDVVDQPVEH